MNGELLSENRSGTKRDHVPDPLGSTEALLDSSQTKTDTFTYWPYGEVKTRTGTNTTPFQYVGTRGYFQDSSTKAYVRARYLDVQKGRWLTRDPLFSLLSPYEYSGNSPLVMFDPSGKSPLDLACLVYPGGPCAYAKALGDDLHNWGGVVCCNGQKFVCSWYTGSNDLITKCLLEHEQSHLTDVDCPCTGYVRPGWRTGADPDWEECYSYRREIRCLFYNDWKYCDKLPPASRSACYEEVNGRRCLMCDKARNEKCKKNSWWLIGLCLDCAGWKKQA